jgi:hypothetical protein
VLLFEGLLEKLHDEKDMYTKKVQKAMSSILSTTKDYTPMVMGTLMEIALCHGRYIVLQPEDIATGILMFFVVLSLTVTKCINIGTGMQEICIRNCYILNVLQGYAVARVFN